VGCEEKFGPFCAAGGLAGRISVRSTPSRRSYGQDFSPFCAADGLAGKILDIL